MAYNNNIMFVRYRLLAELVKMWKEDQLLDKIDHLPIELHPRTSKPQGRCCIHKERAVTKYKIMAMLGFDMSDEKDEAESLKSYAQRMYDRDNISPGKKILTVMDEACSSCVKINYEISNLCRGCAARPCYVNCPKDAISYDKEGKAHIDHDKCISCGKCHQVCPYHAIIYMPVPCEEACPVKAISKDEYGIEHIDPNKCIYCGKCLNACPFGAIFDQCSVFDVLKRMKAGKKVVAMVAPAVLAQFGKPIEQVFGALKAAGFSDIIEVAYGAEETTRRESEEFKEKMEEGQPFMTTSCCPAYVNLARKHIPDLVKYVSTTASPMVYTAEYARKKHPDGINVFIAPCASKKAECREHDNVDFVWTFRELDSVFEGLGINIDDCPPFTPEESACKDAHGFAKTGGVFTAVKNLLGAEELEGLVIADLNKKNIGLLRAYAKTGKCPGKMVEVMSCPGGCITGPCACTESNEAARRFEAEIKKKE
ncbi:MAG: 4Fe-4S binding protein [Bacteroidaceae bacterium]|nr:4Fe-4S binding protein [Bacteroidaceae bacterium]MBQ8270773.1 4Fe-4S binding protein [Bacteroidaceae bacterium]